MIFFTPIIVRYMKKNLNILKSRYNKQNINFVNPFALR